MNNNSKIAKLPDHSKKLPNGAFSHNVYIPPDLKGREIWDYLADLIKSKNNKLSTRHLRAIFRQPIHPNELEEEKLKFELSGIISSKYHITAHPRP